MQCGAGRQAMRHHREGTGGAARHAGCSGQKGPFVTARRRRQGSVGQVRECTGPAMPQHTYTQRAHNTHSPARLPLPVGRHPGLCPLVTAPSAQHSTTQHNTAQHNTTQHNTTQHNTTQHNTTQHNTTQHITTQHNTTQHGTTQHNATQHNTTEHNTTQHNTTQHNTTQHNTTQHNTTQHNTTQHNTTQQTGLHTGAGHLRGNLWGELHAGEGSLPGTVRPQPAAPYYGAQDGNIHTMAVLAHGSSHRDTVLDTTLLLCGAQPQTAPHLWACSAQSHEWGPGHWRLPAWVDQKVGPRAASVRHQLWEPAYAGAVGSSPPDPLYSASPPGVYGSPRAWHAVPLPHHRGVYLGLVRPRQGSYHAAEGLPGPGQHNCVGVAGAAPTPASRAGRSAAGVPRISTVARGGSTRSLRLPLSPPRPTHIHTARARNTQPRPFTCIRW